MRCGNSSAFIYFDCAMGGIQESPERLDFLKGVYNELKNVARAEKSALATEEKPLTIRNS